MLASAPAPTTTTTSSAAAPNTTRPTANEMTEPAPAPARRRTFRAMTMATTTITSDPGILCFHHCNVKVFCFTLPNSCPNCKAKLHNGKPTRKLANLSDAAAANNKHDNVNTDDDNVVDDYETVETVGNISMKLLPFRLPYPFVRAAQYPCAIVLRPTTGDFLNDYNNATDLHIAVTTSTGCIVEFDRYGLQRHRASAADNMPEWWQCLLVGDVPEPWYDYWDDILMQICKEPNRWSVDHYNEDTHNCYTFVLAFLQALGYDKLSEAAHSKTVFCEKYIVPRTTTAGKYISLYRKLRDVGIYVHQHHQSTKSQQSVGKMRSYIMAEDSTGSSTSSSSSSSLTTRITVRTKMKASAGFSITTRTPTLCTIEE